MQLLVISFGKYVHENVILFLVQSSSSFSDILCAYLFFLGLLCLLFFIFFLSSSFILYVSFGLIGGNGLKDWPRRFFANAIEQKKVHNAIFEF